jgi:hypothetical protein
MLGDVMRPNESQTLQEAIELGSQARLSPE